MSPRSSPPSPSQSKQTVADTLRSMRQKAKLSQRQLAENLGVSQTWVYARETARARVDLADLLAWCWACGHEPIKAFEQLLDLYD